MAFMYCHSRCAGCRALIAYNPDLVPSLKINGERQAICLVCLTRWSEIHCPDNPVVPHPDAYEPQEVEG